MSRNNTAKYCLDPDPACPCSVSSQSPFAGGNTTRVMPYALGPTSIRLRARITILIGRAYSVTPMVDHPHCSVPLVDTALSTTVPPSLNHRNLQERDRDVVLYSILCEQLIWSTTIHAIHSFICGKIHSHCRRTTATNDCEIVSRHRLGCTTLISHKSLRFMAVSSHFHPLGLNLNAIIIMAMT